ncbi:MAG: TIGR00159 family protein [Firmicutes bacterium GWF2_51_9]|nr:MAG: TIGR00159 family protein [Firmicutes bacterium GWF2_51_9]OGS58547.1 MAG: TIGR00159 family protein [Firmicutes bacterium GWE2_51_13]HAM62751.1 TIGR00159 family protein [Erysipelotrichaceae bacterium]HAO61972.1 TIGR00159 family protein [Erysipelotrichaceae bacterium]HBZ41916.1 TIGR00159 family protein [Erysipelotrichaceae bacterium]
MLNYQTIQTIITLLRMFFDILIMWILLYYTIKLVRNNSRTTQIFKGIFLILLVRAFANFFGLQTVAWVADIFVTWGFLAVIIIFQPEIRGLLEKLGKTSIFSRISTLSGNERVKLVEEIEKSVDQMSASQTGALITLEQGHSLNDFVHTGTILNSIVTSELLTSIFVTSTPLHDGAVIIQGDRIACASAYFPPTSLDLPTRYGARHRAAIGISEITDSITIVVSEQTGRVSVAVDGKLTTMTKESLHEFLEKHILHSEKELNPIRKKTEVPVIKLSESGQPVESVGTSIEPRRTSRLAELFKLESKQTKRKKPTVVEIKEEVKEESKEVVSDQEHLLDELLADATRVHDQQDEKIKAEEIVEVIREKKTKKKTQTETLDLEDKGTLSDSDKGGEA